MIKHIEFRGKKYPFRHSYKASKGVVADLGREFNGEAEVFDFEGAESLIYHCIRSGCDYTGEPFDLKKDQMEDVMDEIGFKGIGELFAAFHQPRKRGRPEKK